MRGWLSRYTQFLRELNRVDPKARYQFDVVEANVQAHLRGSPRAALISRLVSTRRRSVTRRLIRRPICSTRTPTSSSLACRSSKPAR
jgi:hypothetical protein